MARLSPEEYADELFKTFDNYLLKNLKPIVERLEALESKTMGLESRVVSSGEPALADVIDASVDDGVLTVTLSDGNTRSILLQERK
jgi:hypothetical protein